MKDGELVDNGIPGASSADEEIKLPIDIEANGDHPISTLRHKRMRGGKRKRADADDAANLGERLFEFQHSPHYLRIPASSVSALCGLHPFQDLPQLLFDLVYQSYSGQVLLQRDAGALGLTLVDAITHEREAMLTLASAASDETRELVKQVLEVSDGKRKLQSVDQVQSIQKRIKDQAAKAQEKGILSKGQVESLVEASRGHVSTGFGTCHEDEALDAYEKRIGCRVRERNEALMEWRFQRVHDERNEFGVTAVPIGKAKRRVWEKRDKQQVNDEEETSTKHMGQAGSEMQPIEIDGDDSEVAAKRDAAVGVDHGPQENAVASSPSTAETKPFFRIVGAVDGIRDELYMDSTSHIAPVRAGNECRHDKSDCDNFSDEDEGQWALRPIIVECKHRMSVAKVPPPLYDQIQTCLYCHMYDVDEADLIQVVRRKKTCSEGKENHISKNIENRRKDKNSERKMKSCSSESEEMNITVSRINLNDPIHNHSHHWEATLLPRLASFVDAVYNVRRDDCKRYRLLMALVQSQQEDKGRSAEEEKWNILFKECSWLRHCDTSFRNIGRRF